MSLLHLRVQLRVRQFKEKVLSELARLTGKSGGLAVLLDRADFEGFCLPPSLPAFRPAGLPRSLARSLSLSLSLSLFLYVDIYIYIYVAEAFQVYSTNRLYHVI